MKIILPGGSGQVGHILARTFQRDGHEVIVLSRHPRPAPWKIVAWDGVTLGLWTKEIDGAEVVINLAGRSVNCRYGTKNRHEILRSRIDSTRAVGRAIAAAPRPPRVWLQAGTATIYAHRHDAPNDEITGALGGSEPNVPETWRFSIEVARAWEQALRESTTPQTRQVILRSAMIMSPEEGGVFSTLLGLVRAGLGGRAGDGRQYVSWIHTDDFVRAVYWLIEREDLRGPINLAAPHPLPNAAFMRALRQAAGTCGGWPAARWMLEIGARLMRTETELILKSRRVVPTRLVASGFEFRFPEWPDAARDLVRRWRADRAVTGGSRRSRRPAVA